MTLSSTPRNGLSLLEVIVSLAIFLLTMVALGHMINLASERALEVQQQGQAAQLCQAKMAEVMAGALPLTAQSETPLDEDPAWNWSMETEQTDIPNLWRVHIRISRERSNGNRIECAMSQMMIDPAMRGSVFDNPSTTASTDTGTGTGTTSSSSSSGTTSSGGSSGGSSAQPSSGSSGAQPGRSSGGSGTGSSSFPTPTPQGGSGGSGTGSTTPRIPSPTPTPQGSSSGPASRGGQP